MRVMVLGAGGMLAHDLVACAPRAIELVTLTHDQLDITDHDALHEIVTATNPELIMNAAAYTSVDRAESDRDGAFDVNSLAAAGIGRSALRVGAKVVHFSTDYVFDGTAAEPYSEDAATNPINVYGASKLAGEQALMRSGTDLLLIRTQWLFGDNGRCFPRTMLDRAQRDLPTRVVADQSGRPTYTRDLAELTWRLIGTGCGGVWHAANAEPVAWHDVAKAVFTSEGKADLVSPCSTSEYPTPARRPSRAILDTTKIERQLGASIRSWRLALDEFLVKARSSTTTTPLKEPGPDARPT